VSPEKNSSWFTGFTFAKIHKDLCSNVVQAFHSHYIVSLTATWYQVASCGKRDGWDFLLSDFALFKVAL
jgi:hypothetical protein